MSNSCRKVSRGQVWFLVDPYAPAEYNGSVQGKNRPWLVVSNNLCNQSSPTYTVVPLTTARKTSLPTHVIIDDGKVEQTILCEQIRTISANTFCNNGSSYKYMLSEKTMREVDEALSVQLGLQICFPNSDRYWESLERLIRAQVRLAIDNSKVSAIDINAVANQLNDKVAEIAKQEVNPAPPIAEQLAHVPIATMPPERNISCNKEEGSKGWVPHKPSKTRNDWTTAKMQEFLDDCYKYGVRTVAEKWKLTVQTVYVNKAKFKKLLGDNNGEQST